MLYYTIFMYVVSYVYSTITYTHAAHILSYTMPTTHCPIHYNRYTIIYHTPPYHLPPIYIGLMYLKVKMDPDVADAIESVEGVIRFVRTQNTKLVMPLPVKQGENLEAIRSNLIRDLPLETKKMKKNDYVSVISGIHIGRYGILSASKAGLFEVRPYLYSVHSYVIV